MKITINGKNTAHVFRGAGMVSGNNSSRLLVDYKYEHPEKYAEIMEHIFGKDGIDVTHFKLEMGSDVNSTSGTEPCVKRYPDEKTDVTRGAGFIIAADARKINPDLKLDMLYWSEPKWVTDAEDVYAARYLWYKENLCAAYEKFGLKFDYVSISRNERDIDPEWIKYCAARLKEEKDCPYDFSEIKTVAADEDNNWFIADKMTCDPDLIKAVDVIGSHYTSHSTENAQRIAAENGMELWFSEGCPPMSYSKGTSRFGGNGLAGQNGVLDIASRITAMYPCGKMNLYEYQPVVSAYYDGVTFCHKQLITANEPWSGHYTLDSGYYMALHFSRFVKKGWRYIPEGCFFDGKKEGHTLVNAKHCIMTVCSEEGDYTSVMVNPSSEQVSYSFETENLKDSTVYLWETRGNDGGAYNENYFVRAGKIQPDNGRFEVTLKPYSMCTMSTLDTAPVQKEEKASEPMPLPYKDDYTFYPDEYITERGGMPKFTADQGGAFELVKHEGRTVLMQKILPETKAMEWGGTPDPTTSFGDDRWFDYSIAADIILADSNKAEEVYAGVGLRSFFCAPGVSGYCLFVHGNGSWRFQRGQTQLLNGKAIPAKELTLKLEAEGRSVKGYLNGEKLFDYTAEENEPVLGGGRAVLYSSFDNNIFIKTELEPIGDTPYITRYDDTDDILSYGGEWEHELMSSFSNYRRTISKGSEGAEASFTFDGTGFGMFGANDEKCVVSISIDSGADFERELPASGVRETFFLSDKMEKGSHDVRIKVVSGKIVLDGICVR
ncbi:MAG: glycosyl hydrolase family 59 [Oscillospiraceae bacterium]|nr:glycosyl hydrolase family 59 [Oscillospiraceae bacterium]